jgi:hypothetical protein
MNPAATLLIGLGVGASLMYLIDPQGRNRRRAVIGDKVKRGLRKAGDAADATSRDLGNRSGASPRWSSLVSLARTWTITCSRNGCGQSWDDPLVREVCQDDVRRHGFPP